MNLKAIAAIACAGNIIISTASAEHTINWSAEAVSFLFDSQGQVFPDTWTVALGTFGDSFMPDENNTADWTANWVPLDSTTYGPAPDPPNFPTFQSSVVISDLDRADEKIYMWFYNNQDGDITSEWALISDSTWNVTNAALLQAGQPGPIDSLVMQDATEIEWGRLTSNSSGIIEGGGIRSDDPSSFDLQTHTFPPPVPEPSVSLALMLGMFLLGGRCRRRRG